MRKPSELGAGFFRVFFGRTGFVAEAEATPMLAKPSHYLRLGAGTSRQPAAAA
jgi:hypothetical protein